MTREELINYLAEKLSTEYTRGELADLSTEELENLYNKIAG